MVGRGIWWLPTVRRKPGTRESSTKTAPSFSQRWYKAVLEGGHPGCSAVALWGGRGNGWGASRCGLACALGLDGWILDNRGSQVKKWFGFCEEDGRPKLGAAEGVVLAYIGYLHLEGRVGPTSIAQYVTPVSLYLTSSFTSRRLPTHLWCRL